MVKPNIQYLFQDNNLTGANISGDTRVLTRQGRSGINTTSIHSRLEFPKHNLNDKKGSLSIWMLSLEDLGCAYHIDSFFGIHNAHYENYTFLSDCPEVNNFEASVFSLTWGSRWYPQLVAKFYRGNIYNDAYRPVSRAISSAGHIDLHRNQWYQVVFTWDKDNSLYQIYVNGILTAVSDQYTNGMQWELCGKTLFAGNPTLCISDTAFYDEILTSDHVKELYIDQTTFTDASIMDELEAMYLGKNTGDFHWLPDSSWITKLDLTLTNPEDLKRFYVQGKTDAPTITKDGLLIETDSFEDSLTPKYAIDTSQVYLWSDTVFEGDLYVEYEFNPLKNKGLSLLMTNASGMQREDFMKDYPLRINGSMQMVCWEDVRNYHWEYFREVVDTRNDVASHVIVKNPWLKPMGYRCMDEPLATNEWHKLQYLQQGRKITCAIDSTIVLQVEDDPFNNNGPFFDFGRIAIRCMIDTKMLFRNLRVFNKESLESK